MFPPKSNIAAELPEPPPSPRAAGNTFALDQLVPSYSSTLVKKVEVSPPAAIPAVCGPADPPKANLAVFKLFPSDQEVPSYSSDTFVTPVATVNQYDGTVFATAPSIPTATGRLSGAGPSTAAIIYGGDGPPGSTAATVEFTGATETVTASTLTTS